MNELSIMVVRVYLTEGESKLNELLGYLHDEAKVRGTTVYRGISGFGPSGKVHSSSLVDMSLDLPVTVEFFEETHKAEAIIQTVSDMIDAGHVIYWPATTLS